MPRSGHGYHGYQVGGRDSVGAFLHPTNGYRGALAKRGVRPKNHVKENFAALKSKQAENRAKKEAMAAAASGGLPCTPGPPRSAGGGPADSPASRALRGSGSARAGARTNNGDRYRNGKERRIKSCVL